MNKFIAVEDGRVVAVTFAGKRPAHNLDLIQFDGATVPELGWSYDGVIFSPPEIPPILEPVIPEPQPVRPYKSYTYQLFLKVLSDDELELLIEKKNGAGRPAAKIERFFIRLEQRGIDFNQPMARNALAAMVPGIFADKARIDQIINND